MAAAFQKAVDEVVKDMEAAPSETESDQHRQSYIDLYLSQDHLQDRGQGCPLAAMGAEIALHENEAKDAASATIDRMAALLAEDEGGSSRQGMATMALLLGTITLARLKPTKADADAVLDAGRTGVSLLQQNWPD